MLLDGVCPGGEFDPQFLALRSQPQGHDAFILRPGFTTDEALCLQGADGLANCSLGKVELPGDLADPAKLHVVVEQIDEELGLDRAKVVLLSLLPEQETEGLREPLEDSDDLAVYVRML